MEIPVSMVEGLLGMAVGGIMWWLWRNEDRINALKEDLSSSKIELAKNYHSKEELRNVVNDAIFPLRNEIERLARAIERLGDE
jgi:hypothetical protein